MNGVKANADRIAQALKASMGNISLTARSLKCERGWLSRKIHKTPMLKAILDDQREGSIDNAESALNRAVVQGEGWAVCFLLKTIGRSRGYSERWEMEELRKELEAFKNELYGRIDRTKKSKGKILPSGKSNS